METTSTTRRVRGPDRYLLRWCFDPFQADRVFDLLLATAPMRKAAELVYFHRKGGVRV